MRKCAHFAEYAVLGIERTVVIVYLTRKVVSSYLWADLFAVLLIAVLDEYVQTFFGRTSLAVDVLIDFSGALAGIALTLIVASIMKRGDRLPVS